MKMANFCAMLATVIVGTAALNACTSTMNHESTGQIVDSSAITVAVKTKLAADSDISSLDINVTTFKDIVTLRGKVKTLEQKHKAVADASSVSGVRSVNDELKIVGGTHHHHHHHKSSSQTTSMNTDTGTTGTTTGTTGGTTTTDTTGTTGTGTTDTTTTTTGQ
jgi:hyperosmotically inducible protein